MFSLSGSKVDIFCEICKKCFQILNKISNFANEMAGIYVHIPFCKSRCIYCGFYSTTRLELRQRYVDALCREMETRGGCRADTVYLGGGTPSQLTPDQLRQLFLYINKVYDVSADAEITLECNPDDVTPAFAELLSELPVNRVSMGAQTFSDERLRFLRRRHSAVQVPRAVELLRSAGIRNISVDLMYGFPGQTMEEWRADIRNVLELNAEHLSAYSLMYEENTPLYQLLQTGKIHETDEELSREMYYTLIDQLAAAGYEHYEISNFARPGFRSRHNSSYWHDVPYVGLGAAAHSYDGGKRQWNTDDIEAYLEGIEAGTPQTESEEIDEQTRYNERMMLGLRTCEGVDLRLLSEEQRRYCLQSARKYLEQGLLEQQGQQLRLTRKGLFVSDMVMSDLFMEEP